MPPNRFESEVESFLEGSHGDRTHIKRADHHTVTPLCGTLLALTRNGVYWLVQHALKANSDNEFFATMNRQDGRSCESSIGSI